MFNNLNILEMFFQEPGREFNVREVARLTNKAPATVSKKLKQLEQKKILKMRSERGFDLYSADLLSDSYKDIKTYYTIRKIRESGIIDALNRYYLKPTIALFGSSAIGMDAELSDIDMLIVSEKTKRMDTSRYEKIIKRHVQLFCVKEIRDLKNEHLINNVLNGITLQGKLKWI